MSSTIKRFAALALLMALPVMAFAQTSRVQGLNVQGDYIKDYTGIYTYTSAVSGVGNLIYGELGQVGPVDRAVGAVLGNLWDGRYGTWAIHLREWTPALGGGDTNSHPGAGANGFDPNSNSSEAFDIMWGKKFGTTSVGLRLNRSYARFEESLSGVGIATDLKYDFTQAAADPNAARNILGFGGGIGFELSPKTTAELAFLYSNRQFEAAPNAIPVAATKNEDDGGGSYLLAARAMWQWQPNVMVVPVFKYYTFDLSNKVTGGTAAGSYDNSLKGWQAGVAGNWTLGTNDLFVLGVTFAQNKIQQQYDLFGLSTGSASDSLTATETLMPQVFAGLETHVNNWLTLRFGAKKGAFERLKTESDSRPDTEKRTVSSFSMNLGAGIKLGTLMLDAVLNNEFPHNMPYLVSGNVTSPMFTKVTATYAF